jgi:hypothetical protein
MKRNALLLRLAVPFVVSLLAGCDMAGQLKDSVVHGEPIALEIEREIGKKPQVFSFSVGTDSFSQVMVQFAEPPLAPLPEIEAVVRAAVVHEYKAEPATLMITFIYDKAHAKK